MVAPLPIASLLPATKEHQSPGTHPKVVPVLMRHAIALTTPPKSSPSWYGMAPQILVVQQVKLS